MIIFRYKINTTGVASTLWKVILIETKGYIETKTHDKC